MCIICIDRKKYQSQTVTSVQGLFQTLEVWACFLRRNFGKKGISFACTPITDFNVNHF